MASGEWLIVISYKLIAFKNAGTVTKELTKKVTKFELIKRLKNEMKFEEKFFFLRKCTKGYGDKKRRALTKKFAHFLNVGY